MDNKAEQHKYALLSKASYDNYFMGVDKAQDELSLYPETRPFGINTTLSNPNSTVLVSPNEVVISYRGTDLKNVSDLTADAQIVLGLDKIPIHFVDRFSEANKTYKKVKQEYPDRPITLTGHSLGSTESVYVGMLNDVRSVSFNEGASPLSTLFSQITGNPESFKKQKIYLTGKDILSNSAILQPYEIQFVPIKDKFNFIAHSLNYFLPPPTDTVLPDWLLPKAKMPRYKPTKGINYGFSELVPENQEYFIKKKKKKVKDLEEQPLE
jgi:hypothetical protein